jgi:8-oxo-dGTP pyrophosphatase MutT (NUDIX family)
LSHPAFAHAMYHSRLVARVLLIDRRDRVLLLDTQLAYTRVWLTPGGALKAGETYEECAHRELWEETGLRGVSLGPWLWSTHFRFRYQDVVHEQSERYFVARMEAWDLRDDHWEQSEHNEIKAHCWWSPEDIAASSEQFRPADLANLLPPVPAGDYPDEPVSVQIEAGAITEPK